MTDRQSMDRPATITAATLGLLLITISVLLFAFTGGAGAGGNTFTVTWAQSELESEQKPFGAQDAQVTIPIAVDAAVSNLTVELTCTDNPGTPPRGVATVDWALTDADGNEIDSGENVACAAASFGPYRVSGHPDVAEVSGDGEAEAREQVWRNAMNTTTTYTLTFSYDRAAAQTDPLPQAVAASVAGNMALTVDEWQPTLNEKEAEAPR